MKKILSILMIILMLAASLFILTGCGEDEVADNEMGSDDMTAQVIELPMNIANLYPDTTIVELYTTGAGLDNWGEDILGGQTMSTGEQISVILMVDQNNVQWDLKAVDSVGTEVVFTGLDLSNVSTDGGTITIQMDSEGNPVAIAQ